MVDIYYTMKRNGYLFEEHTMNRDGMNRKLHKYHIIAM